MNELEHCLADKVSQMKNLLAETRRLSDHVAKGDIDALALSLDVRQGLMDGIDVLDGRIRQMGSAQNSMAADSLRAEIGTLLKSIMELDADIRLHTGEMATALITGMREVKAEKKMMAYRANESTGSKFVNREG